MLHHPCILGGPQQREQNRKSKPTPGVTMMHHATKRGFKDCPKCAPLAHPLKGHRWGTGPKRCPARARRANVPPLTLQAAVPNSGRSCLCRPVKLLTTDLRCWNPAMPGLYKQKQEGTMKSKSKHTLCIPIKITRMTYTVCSLAPSSPRTWHHTTGRQKNDRGHDSTVLSPSRIKST